MTAAQRVQDQLDRWATMTPDEIAADLRKRGVKGHATRCSDCPVVLALTGVAGAGGIVRVGLSHVLTADHLRPAWQELSLPPSVVALVDRIDRGFYPELEA